MSLPLPVGSSSVGLRSAAPLLATPIKASPPADHTPGHTPPARQAPPPRPPGLSSRGRSGFNGAGESWEEPQRGINGFCSARAVQRPVGPLTQPSTEKVLLQLRAREGAGGRRRAAVLLLHPPLRGTRARPVACGEVARPLQHGSWPQESEGRRGPARSQQVRGECPPGLASCVPILGPAGPGGTQETFAGTSGQAARGGRA